MAFRAAQIVGIFTTTVKGAPMVAQAEVKADAGQGLVGDRYHWDPQHPAPKHGPDREITLIEDEALEAALREQGIPLTPDQCRRNLITQGVPLNHLVNVTFRVGDAILKGIRLCEPCNHLEELTHPGIRSALVHRGGLRAQILKSGIIRVGDSVEPTEPNADSR